MNRFGIGLLIVMACLSGLAQPSSNSNAPLRDTSGFLPVPTVSNAPASTLSNQTNSAQPPPSFASGGYMLDDKHKLLPGDRISFQILEDHTNAVSLLVAESDELDVPYIGRVSVAGKTCKQLADELKAALEKDYYYKATVIIGLDTLTKALGHVYVWGPVRNPGPVEIPANETFTVSKAIARAGGFGDFANKKEVKVSRKTPTGTVEFKVNLVNVLEKGKVDEDIALQPEDFVIVPQRAINF